MSKIVTTDLGRFRLVQTQADPLEHAWLFECPGCGEWAYLDDDQWHGRVSVDHASMGCAGGYHETHNYQADLRAVIASRQLTFAEPFDADVVSPASQENR
jgi:hypothetical protein